MAGGSPYRLLLLILFAAAAGDSRSAQPAMDVVELPFREQTMSLEFEPDGGLLVGTDLDLHRFDGVRWQALGLRDQAPIRSLQRDARGRIWVGAYDHFGYLKIGDDGQRQFVDLSTAFADMLSERPRAGIWKILIANDTVYFRGLYHVLAVDLQGHRAGAWQHAGRFGDVLAVGSTVWVQKRGEGGGFFQLQTPEQSQRIAGSEAYASPLVYNAFALSDGRVLAHQVDLQPTTFSAMTGVRAAIPSTMNLEVLTVATELGKDVFAFGGRDGLLQVLDMRAGQTHALSLGHSYVADLKPVGIGELAQVDETRVVRLAWPVGWRVHTASDGLRGTPHAIRVIGDDLLLLGGTGVFRSAWQANQIRDAFSLLPWSAGEGWDAIPVREGILYAESYSLLLINGGQRRAVSPDDLYPRVLQTDPENADWVWVGTEHGLALMARSRNGWELTHRWPQDGLRVQTLARCGDQVVIGSEQGVFSAPAGDRGETLSAISQLAGESIAADVYAVEGRCYVSRQGSVHQWQDGKLIPDESLGLAEILEADEQVDLRSVAGKLWAITERRILRRDGDRQWTTLGLDGHERASFDLVAIADSGRLLLSKGTELWEQLDAENERLPTPPRPQVSAARLITRQGSRFLPLNGLARFTAGEGSLQLDFNPGRVFNRRPPEFAFRLTGLETAWSPFDPQASTRLGALGPGDYGLDLRMRVGAEQFTAPALFKFGVDPRWYQRTDVQLLTLILIAIACAGLISHWHRRRLHDLRERNVALDALVNERTAMWAAANRELQEQADRDGLTGVANRRVFDRELDNRTLAARINSSHLALMMVDVDHFKRFNDEHGHLRGDEVLRAVANAMRAVLPPGAVLARYGGEEFAVLCDLPIAAARELGESLRASVHASGTDVSVSIGLAALTDTRDGRSDQLVDAADHALYAAKSLGRDRLCLASEDQRASPSIRSN